MNETTSIVVLVTGFLTLIFLLLIGRIIRSIATQDVDISLKGLGITLEIKRFEKRRPVRRELKGKND